MAKIGMRDNLGRFVKGYIPTSQEKRKRLLSLKNTQRKTTHAIVRLVKNTLVNSENGCWEYNKYIAPNGYASVATSRSTSELAHRLSYRYFVGDIPEGKQIDHLCRNRKCVNPAHLEAVTQRENIRRGLLTKLSFEDIDRIKDMYNMKLMKQQQLAEMFGVGQDVISRVVNGKAGYSNS